MTDETTPNDGAEIVKIPSTIEVVDPETGEVTEVPITALMQHDRGAAQALAANATDRSLAWAFDRFMLVELVLKSGKSAITHEMLSRMDRNGEWTIHCGDIDLSGDSPERIVYEDPEQLYNDLKEAVEEGIISQEALDAAVRKETVYTAMKGKIKALLKTGGVVKDIIEGHQSDDPRPRRLTRKVKK